eukprot:GHVS01089059.1.p2 GENE.GHVS01089059.1~~GHVS01089059.1.p2  ORF type:complete len:109 (+),score=8.76 GHVS01089059.1:789-1115(+)
MERLFEAAEAMFATLPETPEHGYPAETEQANTPYGDMEAEVYLGDDEPMGGRRPSQSGMSSDPCRAVVKSADGKLELTLINKAGSTQVTTFRDRTRQDRRQRSTEKNR